MAEHVFIKSQEQDKQLLKLFDHRIVSLRRICLRLRDFGHQTKRAIVKRELHSILRRLALAAFKAAGINTPDQHEIERLVRSNEFQNMIGEFIQMIFLAGKWPKQNKISSALCNGGTINDGQRCTYNHDETKVRETVGSPRRIVKNIVNRT